MLNSLDEQFLTTSQEDKKLQIALSRYFSSAQLSPECKKRYEAYLKKRLRPCMLKLLEIGDFSRFVSFAETGWMNEKLYQEAILKSADLGKSEITVYLLRNQNRLSVRTAENLALDF